MHCISQENRTFVSQKQHDIEVKFRKGKSGIGTRTGNNAAWLCRCEREQPLVGYSDTIQSRRASSDVVCPSCGLTYRVVASGLRKAPNHVEELVVEAG